MAGAVPPASASAPAPASIGGSAAAAVAGDGTCLPPECRYRQWPRGDWRPYSSDSVFNNRIVDAVVAPRSDSASIVQGLASARRAGTKPSARPVKAENATPAHLTVRADGLDGWPTYWTRSDDPQTRSYTVTCVKGAGGCPGQTPFSRTVPLPTGARPQGPIGSDQHLTVVDQSAYPMREYDFWKTELDDTSRTGTVQGMGWQGAVTSGGVTEVPPGNATAAMFGNLAGRIRAEELLTAMQHADDPVRGVLRHALTIAVECHSGRFTPPARQAPTSGTCVSDGVGAPMGARLYLPAHVDLEALFDSWTNGTNAPAPWPWQKVLLRTVQQYGMYVNDTGSEDFLFTMQKEGGLQYKALGASNSWWQVAAGRFDAPADVKECTSRGFNVFAVGSPDFVCAGHWNQDNYNAVPNSIWQQLKVAALTVDRSLRPSAGRPAGGERVTLHGTGLRGTVHVAFGGTVVTGTASTDGTSVTVVTPPHAPGTVDVTVRSSAVAPQGQVSETPVTVTLPAAFRYSAAGTAWSHLPGAVREVSVAADGTAWAIGTKATAGGFGIYRWAGSGWAAVPGGAVRIAGDREGGAWVLNSAGKLYRRAGAAWQALPGSARELSVGADGTAWVIGTKAVPGGYGVYRWDGAAWRALPGGAVNVAGGPDGRVWVINSAGTVYRRAASTWEKLPGSARHLAVGADGTAWAVGTNAVPGGYALYRWTGAWTRVPGGAVRVAVDPVGQAWIANATQAVYRQAPSSMAVRVEQAAADFAARSRSGERLQASREVLTALGLSATHDFTRAGARPQVLLTAAGRQALFTVSELTGVSGRVARLTAEGLNRRLGAGTAPLTATVTGDLSAAVGVMQNPLQGRVDAAVAVVAPHGGSIEVGTDQQADQAASDTPLSALGVRAWTVSGSGRSDGSGGAFDAWHITSTDLSERSFPGLAGLLSTRYPYAVTFHGSGGAVADVLVGGRAPLDLRQRVAARISKALGRGFTARAAGTGDTLAGTEPDNIVNRLSDRGLQLEQSPRVRQDPSSRDAVVDALAQQLTEETGR